MALLTIDERKAIFKELGLGDYNEANIKAFQKKHLYRKSDWDGKYGTNTDNLLRTVYYTKKYTKNFSPKEFRCECGGKYCCGYPSYMKPAELIHIQKIRDHWGKPITITCGLRDKKYNASLGGSVQNSLHLKGQALDFYMSGVTDTLAHRKSAIKWIKGQSNHHYTYGNGINSSGYSVRAPYMGNALHTDTYDNVKPTHPTLKGTTTQEVVKNPSTSEQKPSATTSTATSTTAKKLTVSGVGNKTTIKAMQKFFGTTQDGVISGQNASLKKYYPSIKSVSYGKGGSACVKKLQKWLGVKQDGILGKTTVKAWQKKIGTSSDGIFGTNSMKAWQKYLNSHDKPTYPATSTKKPTTTTSTATKKPTTTAKTTNAQKIVAKAKAFAWAYGTASKKWKYKTGSARSAYKTALKKYLKRSAKISRSDCGYFVTTCVRASGVSKSFMALRGTKQSFPKVPSTMKIVWKGKKIPSGTLKPGDIIRYKKKNGGQHVLMYYANGRIAEGQRGHGFPAIKKDTKKYNKSNVRLATLQVIRAK